ncbi:MAG: nucleotide exchange factor GrpE [Planctomycetes bacterium]|nr:nucleotide exchange factor GrpE [Planctomycetota bacterium]
MSKVKKSNDENAEDMKAGHEDEDRELEEETVSESEAKSDGAEDVQPDEDSYVEDQIILTEEEVLEFKKKAEEYDSLLEQLLRTRAEFSNYQKRMRKELEIASNFAVQGLVLDIFPELDNFERALKHSEASGDLEKFVEGVRLIQNQLLKVLGKYGVKPIEPVGKPFDPSLHEAVLEEDNNDLPHHTVTGEFQQGFLLKERVIRPSKVKVSKRTDDDDEDDDETRSDEDSS